MNSKYKCTVIKGRESPSMSKIGLKMKEDIKMNEIVSK
jgi:hypothetical protein